MAEYRSATRGTWSGGTPHVTTPEDRAPPRPALHLALALVPTPPSRGSVLSSTGHRSAVTKRTGTCYRAVCAQRRSTRLQKSPRRVFTSPRGARVTEPTLVPRRLLPCQSTVTALLRCAVAAPTPASCATACAGCCSASIAPPAAPTRTGPLAAAPWVERARLRCRQDPEAQPRPPSPRQVQLAAADSPRLKHTSRCTARAACSLPSAF